MKIIFLTFLLSMPCLELFAAEVDSLPRDWTGTGILVGSPSTMSLSVTSRGDFSGKYSCHSPDLEVYEADGYWMTMVLGTSHIQPHRIVALCMETLAPAGHPRNLEFILLSQDGTTETMSGTFGPRSTDPGIEFLGHLFRGDTQIGTFHLTDH